MYQPMEEILSDWLTDTLNIMICTETANLSSSVLSYIGRYPAFKIHRVSTEKMLDLYLNQNIDWHSIIIDSQLSFSVKVFDELTRFSKWVPVIYLAEELPKGLWDDWIVEEVDDKLVNYVSKNNRHVGAVLEIFKRRELRQLLSTVLANSLKRQLFNFIPDKSIHEATAVLYKENPVTVENWAKINNCTPRKIQRLLKPFINKTPKKLLSIYHAYRMAFAEVDNSGNLNCEVFRIHRIESCHRKRFLEYTLSRRSTLLSC